MVKCKAFNRLLCHDHQFTSSFIDKTYIFSPSFSVANWFTTFSRCCCYCLSLLYIRQQQSKGNEWMSEREKMLRLLLIAHIHANFNTKYEYSNNNNCWILKEKELDTRLATVWLTCNKILIIQIIEDYSSIQKIFFYFFLFNS